MKTFGNDHVSLVTGASSGIGAAIAIQLAERGSSIAVHYRSNEEDAQGVVETIRKLGGNAFLVRADLSHRGAAEELVGEVLRHFDHIDLVVNNAGSIIRRARLLEITDDFWDEVMATNLGSVLRVTRAAARSMIERKSGAIVNIASVAGRNGGSLGIIPYASAKAGVICMTKGLAKELIAYGIRVNGVNPGVIDTPFHKQFTSPEQMKGLVANIPQGRAGQAREIGAVVAFLASDAASHMVGETVEVNGGIWMD